MSTSLLYHGFGVRGYKHVNSRYEGGAVIFTLTQDKHELRCCQCGSKNVVRRGTVERRFRNLPIGPNPTWVVLAVQRVWCWACESVRQVEVGFADVRRSKKGHRYLTIVLDLVSGAVVFVGDGKGADALEPFWQRLKRFKNKIKAVAIDMSPAYIMAVTDNLAKAAIVFDHFHVIKLYNEQLSDLRRKLYQEISEQGQKQLIKGTRWLLLKNPENLDASKNEPHRLQQALQINHSLATAYYLKEALRQLWCQKNKKQAATWLNDWLHQAYSSKIQPIIKFAKTLAAHRTGVLAYFDFPISTGPLEGVNNKIKTMKRQACGFRDMEFFKLKILALHQTKYALVG
jgi:transposase